MESFGLQVINNKVVTSSRNVAEVFEKRHDNVIQATRALECGNEFRLLNFQESSYVNEQNREMPEYLITRDGFTLLAMGFNGKKAMDFKVKYIQAFNEMEARLNNPFGQFQSAIPTSMAEALKLAASLEEQRAELAVKVEADAPKVLFADAVAASHSDINVGDLAKLICQNGYDIGQNRLYNWLRSSGYIMKEGTSSSNMPTQRALQMKLFRVKETAVTTSDGTVIVKKTPKVTPKGQQYFINKFLCTGLLVWDIHDDCRDGGVRHGK